MVTEIFFFGNRTTGVRGLSEHVRHGWATAVVGKREPQKEGKGEKRASDH